MTPSRVGTPSNKSQIEAMNVKECETARTFAIQAKRAGARIKVGAAQAEALRQAGIWDDTVHVELAPRANKPGRHGGHRNDRRAGNWSP